MSAWPLSLKRRWQHWRIFRQTAALFAGARERRTSKRFPCKPEIICHLVRTSPSEPGLWREANGDPWLVKIQNISTRGIGLLLNRSFKTGTFLSLELFNGEQGFLLELEVCVVHTRRQGRGQWLSGGVFVRALRDVELTALL